MPYDEYGQGYGEQTEYKLEQFARIARHHLTIAGFAIRNQTWLDGSFHYWDLTAGAGSSSAIDRGSPLIHLDLVSHLRESAKFLIPVRARLVEIDRAAAEHLARQIRTSLAGSPVKDYGARIFCADHNRVVRDWIVEAGRKRSRGLWTGLIYVDPNGSEPPFDLLKEINDCWLYTRMDMLIYLAAANIKRVRLAFDRDDLVTKLDSVGKKHWLVAHVGGKHQWSFLLGTNYARMGDWKRIGLFDVKSKEGQAVLRKLNYTADEIKAFDQIGLWK